MFFCLFNYLLSMVPNYQFVWCFLSREDIVLVIEKFFEIIENNSFEQWKVRTIYETEYFLKLLQNRFLLIKYIGTIKVSIET